MTMRAPGTTIAIFSSLVLGLASPLAGSRVGAPLADAFQDVLRGNWMVGEPVRLRIPAISVDALIEPKGLTPSGAMDVPSAWENVAWFSPGSRPGQIGSAVLAGHLDSLTGPAVFWDLEDLRIGDIVFVDDVEGRSRKFRVVKTEQFSSDDAPLARLFDRGGSSRVVLLTCGGPWDKGEKSYQERLAVTAELLSP